jgi:hypothetical protein
MSRPSSFGARRLTCLLVAVAAGVAAYALNQTPVFALARLWPGRLLTLPIAIAFGPWYGALAAAVGAPGTYQYSISQLAVFLLEAVVVGYVARGGRRSAFLAGAAIWAVYSLTFLITPKLFVSTLPTSLMLSAGLQRSLKAVTALALSELMVLLVSGLVARYRQPSAEERPSLRDFSFKRFVLVATLPVLLLSTVGVHVNSVREEAQGEAILQRAATDLCEHIDDFVDSHARMLRRSPRLPAPGNSRQRGCSCCASTPGSTRTTSAPGASPTAMAW